MAPGTKNINKIKAGLLLTGNYGWAGGLYYVANIIKSLNYVDRDLRPEIIVFYNRSTPVEILEELKFPFVRFQNLDKTNILKRGINKIRRKISGRNSVVKKLVERHETDVLYPIYYYPNEFDGINCEKIYWIYDFQHKFLPELFTEEELKKREQAFLKITAQAHKIVVSSYDSLSHLNKFYPDYKGAAYVLQFVSFTGDAAGTTSDWPALHPGKYFIVSNQFWKHKNHLLVLKALSLIKKQGKLNFKTVFTGNIDKTPGNSYFDVLKTFIEEESLQEDVVFTGFIRRDDQLRLMKNSLAIIQPSKFEGWSTVIEDAKSLQKKIVASSLPVHKEQLGENASYFGTEDAGALAQCLLELNDQPPLVVQYGNFKERAELFGQQFLAILK